MPTSPPIYRIYIGDADHWPAANEWAQVMGDPTQFVMGRLQAQDFAEAQLLLTRVIGVSASAVPAIGSPVRPTKPMEVGDEDSVRITTMTNEDGSPGILRIARQQ